LIAARRGTPLGKQAHDALVYGLPMAPGLIGIFVSLFIAFLFNISGEQIAAGGECCCCA
jgi:hypothetical protein